MPAWLAPADNEGVRGVMVDLSNAQWFKSSRSGASQNCVEVAFGPEGAVGVRDSKDVSGPALTFTSAEWSRFTTSAMRGDLDP